MYSLFYFQMIRIMLPFIMLNIVFVETDQESKNKKELFYKNSLKWLFNYNNKAINTRTNNFEYEYEDWEEKRPDYYNYDFTSTTETTSSLSTTTAITTTVQDTTLSSVVTSTTTSVTTTTTATTYATETTINDSPGVYIKETTITATTLITKDELIEEIRNNKRAIQGGYFTAGLLVLFKILRSKTLGDLEPLVTGLNAEVTRLNNNHQLVMFGDMVSDIFTSIVRDIASTTIQAEIDEIIKLLENKRGRISPEINAIYDVADSVFEEDDVINIGNVLKDVNDFPNINKYPEDIARDAFVAFLFVPYGRIEGTSKERLLLLEINTALQKRMHLPYYRQRSDDTDTTTSMKVRNFINDSNYIKNKTILTNLKYRMKLYKKKLKDIQKKERGKSKRGPTSKIITTTTTTKGPKMRKSKYYIKKYVRKDLYPMKTTTLRTTTFRYKYYGKIKKFNTDNRKSENYSIKFESNNPEISLDNVNNYVADITPKRNNFVTKNNILHGNNFINSESNEEMKLKMNLNDAMYHKDINITDHGSFIGNNEVNDITEESFSDNETLLKGRIYSLFENNHDFVNTL